MIGGTITRRRRQFPTRPRAISRATVPLAVAMPASHRGGGEPPLQLADNRVRAIDTRLSRIASVPIDRLVDGRLVAVMLDDGAPTQQRQCLVLYGSHALEPLIRRERSADRSRAGSASGAWMVEGSIRFGRRGLLEAHAPISACIHTGEPVREGIRFLDEVEGRSTSRRPPGARSGRRAAIRRALPPAPRAALSSVHTFRSTCIRFLNTPPVDFVDATST